MFLRTTVTKWKDSVGHNMIRGNTEFFLNTNMMTDITTLTATSSRMLFADTVRDNRMETGLLECNSTVAEIRNAGDTVLPSKFLDLNIFSKNKTSKTAIALKIQAGDIVWAKANGAGDWTWIYYDTNKGEMVLALADLTMDEFGILVAMSAPTGLTCAEDSKTLTWVDTSATEEGFEIWVSEDGGEFYLLDTVAEDVETYEDETTTGDELIYKVRAYIGGNYSDFSNTASFSWASYWAGVDWGNLSCKRNLLSPTKDAIINSDAPTFNYGISASLFVGEANNAVDKVLRSLIGFDLSSISDEAEISSVNLVLYKYTNYADNTRKLKVYKMKRAWIEGTKNGAAPADGVTWATYDGTNSWTAPGAFDAADCEQTAIGEFEILYNHDNTFITIPLSITLKSELDYGLLLKMETELNDAHIFPSQQSLTEAWRPVLEVNTKELINGTVNPLLTKSDSNLLFEGAFGSIVYEGMNSYSFFYCSTGGYVVYKRSSTDGIIWGTGSNVMSSLGAELEVCSAWKEGSTHYMLYRSNEWGGDKAIGLATSVDSGASWTKYASNPVITNTDVGAWAIADIDPWGIIKVGLTYYLWINDVNEIPRQTGLATSVDLINWTMNANNPIFENGRFCVSPIKYNDKYYLFVGYTPQGNVLGAAPTKYRIELYRDTSPTFLSGEREFLGNVILGGEDGDWDDDYVDTPSILTTTIERDVFPNGSDETGKMWVYYTGHDGTTWAHGLSVGHLEMLSKLTAITEPAAGE